MHDSGRLLEGRYRMVAKIESGGFADIYVGYDLRLYNRPVVIKMLRRDIGEDEKLVAMFFDETVLTTRLQHENIVQVYDVARSGDDLYLVLELVDGPDLRKVLRVCREKGQLLPFDLTAYVVSKVCLALDYAHSKKDTSTDEPLNIVHRDISPSNILVSLDGKVNLSDFGIAKPRHHHRAKTSTGVLKGKIAYMSPEQARAEQLDRRSDIYSLGIVMYEMLTQAKLFDADSDFELIQMVAKGRVNAKPITDAGVPEPMRVILFKALQKNVSNRYATAYDMYKDLQSYLSASEPTSLPFKLRDRLVSLGLDKESPLSKLREAEPAGGVADLSTREVLKVPAAEGEEKEEERTIYDLIRLSTGRQKKILTAIGSSVLALFLVFMVVATASQWTPVGRWIHNKFFPPAIVIKSIPLGARVALDGEMFKTTPLSISRIGAGSHELVLNLDGYKDIRKSLTVLQRRKGEPADTVVYQFEVPIFIDSDPKGAEIYVDGRRYPGVTPGTITYLIEDEPATIAVKMDGFEPMEKSVSVVGDPSHSITPFWEVRRERNADGIFTYYNLARFYAKVTVKSDPPGATLVVNGADTFSTSEEVTVQLPVGRHLLAVEKAGLVPWSQEVEINNGEPRTIVASLERELAFVAYDKATGREIPCRIDIATAKGTPIASRKATPASVRLVPRMDLKVTFSAKDYQSKTVSFDATRENTVEVRLEKTQYPVLRITAVDDKTGREVPKAWIYLTQDKRKTPEYVGQTSAKGLFERTVSPGYFLVQVRPAGYQPWQRSGVIQPGEQRTMSVRLKREASR